MTDFASFRSDPVPCAGSGSTQYEPASLLTYENHFPNQPLNFIITKSIIRLKNPPSGTSCITTSGRSANVVRALEYAAAEGALTVAVTGAGGAHLRSVAQEVFVVPSMSVQRVEDVAGVITHLLCLLSREKIAAAAPLGAAAETAA